jgi:hypothetical protein
MLFQHMFMHSTITTATTTARSTRTPLAHMRIHAPVLHT